MRRVVWSRTAVDGLQTLLEQGIPKFGATVVAEKRRLLDAFVFERLAEHPHRGRRLTGRAIYFEHVARTPFTVIYDYDDAELRILFIVHNRSDRSRLDPTDVDW